MQESVHTAVLEDPHIKAYPLASDYVRRWLKTISAGNKAREKPKKRPPSNVTGLWRELTILLLPVNLQHSRSRSRRCASRCCAPIWSSCMSRRPLHLTSRSFAKAIVVVLPNKCDRGKRKVTTGHRAKSRAALPPRRTRLDCDYGRPDLSWLVSTLAQAYNQQGYVCLCGAPSAESSIALAYSLGSMPGLLTQLTVITPSSQTTLWTTQK